jgi:outer membrane protein assembly factor BamB
MQKDEKSFQADHVDEQIERLPASLSPTDKRLVRDLQAAYRPHAEQNERSLQRVWERLARDERAAHAGQFELHGRRPIHMRSTMPGTTNTRNGTTRPGKDHIQTGNGRTLLGTLAAVIFVGLLVGGMAFMFNAAHRSSYRPSRAGVSGMTTTGAVKTVPPVSDSPGIYLTTEKKDWLTYQVNKLDIKSHKLLWTHDVASIESAIVVVGDSVYVSSADTDSTKDISYVYALNASTGAQLWRTTLAYDPSSGIQPNGGYLSVLTTPVVANGMVYVSARSGKIYALDAASGALRWSFDSKVPTLIDGTIYDPGQVAVANNVVYGAFYNTLVAVDAQHGTLLWSKQISQGQIFNDPQFVKDTLYIASYEESHHHAGQSQTGYVYAFDAKSGSQHWRYDVGNWVLSDPIVANGMVYFGSYNHLVYALKASDGSKQWSYDTGGQVFDSPIVSNGVVYVDEQGNADEGSIDGRSTVQPALIAINATTGAKLWSKTGIAVSLQTLQDGVLYTSVFPRQLYAFNASNGSVIWHQAYGPDLVDKMGNHSGPAPEITVVP